MFIFDWYGMLKIEYDNGWMSYDNLKKFVEWGELTKDQFADITGRNYDSGQAVQTSTQQ